MIGVRTLATLAIASSVACASPMHTPPKLVPSAAVARPDRVPRSDTSRPAVGMALGGGSARGIAHVGVIRWFQEHRIPIDVAAGTSMGGLVGGAFATGMDGDELKTFIDTLDWDQLFGASTFAYKNIRRKADARAFPSRLEFGLKRGIVPPTSINTGQSVELLLGRITAPYYEIEDFDELPTPFRTVAVDLLSAQPIIMRSGSLADAMRATMSLPLIFPPVVVDGRVLIDGGTMNNVPADVVRAMGADRVVAVNVGDLTDREGVNYSLLGLAGSTIDAMMLASTRRALTSADVVINVPLENYGSLDWRRSDELIEEGYKAAEAMRDSLLPFALSETDYEAWRKARQARRRSELPAPAFVTLEGFASRDTSRLEQLLARHVGQPLDVAALEDDIAHLSGLDRYETITWQVTRDEGRGHGLRVRARQKAYAPPFMMLGLNLENTTSSDFRITFTARYLAYDVVGSGSELRLDGTIGSDPAAAFELYRPIGSTALFVAPYAGIGTSTFNFIRDDAVIARYTQRRMRTGANVGLNMNATSDVRLGAFYGRATASIDIGDPGFPELEGKETGAELVWRMDTQDSPVIPSQGVWSEARLLHLFDGPDLTIGLEGLPPPTSLTQFAATGTKFWARGRNRLFAAGGLGTSFDSHPIATAQFSLGLPFRLGAYSPGELRGAHFYIATGGVFRQFGRLPDFMGGPVYAGAWLENGDAFNDWSAAGWRSNGGLGLVMDTLVGPVVLAGSFGFDGRWRTYLGVGRVFR
jgi:NTE family protein